MRGTLAWQLTSRYLLVLAALLIASAGFQYVALRHFLLTAADDRLTAVARQPVAVYQAAVRSGVPVSTAAEDLVRSVAGPQTAAWVVGPGGSVWAAAAGPGHPKPPGLPKGRPHLPGPPPPAGPGRALVSGGELVATVRLGPGRPGRQGPAVLVLGTRVRDVLAVLGSEVRLLLLGGIGALTLGGASGAWAVRRSLRPLREMTLVADRIAGGDLTARAGQAHAPDEVSRLAGAFDGMVDRLAAAIDEERATHQQMRQFLDDASHELRTPLTALSGTLEVLQGDAGRDLQAVREGLRSAYRQSRRLAGLVSGLLALARAERPEGLPLEPTDLQTVLTSVRPTAERLAADHHLQWEAPVAALPVLANADLLGGALLNVLDNAVRYSPLGAKIQLHAARRGDAAELTVADQGIGIPAQSLPHVFDRFYRCPPADSRSAPGTGLGLAIVRSVMERHHGTATIESAPGQGTTVRLRLPLLESASGSNPPAWGPAGAAVASGHQLG